jgi:hypothetical protein
MFQESRKDKSNRNWRIDQGYDGKGERVFIASIENVRGVRHQFDTVEEARLWIDYAIEPINAKLCPGCRRYREMQEGKRVCPKCTKRMETK